MSHTILPLQRPRSHASLRNYYIKSPIFMLSVWLIATYVASNKFRPHDETEISCGNNSRFMDMCNACIDDSALVFVV